MSRVAPRRALASLLLLLAGLRARGDEEDKSYAVEKRVHDVALEVTPLCGACQFASLAAWVKLQEEKDQLKGTQPVP